MKTSLLNKQLVKTVAAPHGSKEPAVPRFRILPTVRCHGNRALGDVSVLEERQRVQIA